MTARIIPFPRLYKGDPPIPFTPSSPMRTIPGEFLDAMLDRHAAVLPGPGLQSTLIIEAGPPVLDLDDIAEAWDTLRWYGTSMQRRISILWHAS